MIITRETKIFDSFGNQLTKPRSHLFLNLRLTVFIHDDTTLSEYCICDRSENMTEQERKIP